MAQQIPDRFEFRPDIDRSLILNVSSDNEFEQIGIELGLLTSGNYTRWIERGY
jgi:hypothetical protein